MASPFHLCNSSQEDRGGCSRGETHHQIVPVTMERHQKAVSTIASAVRQFFNAKQPFRISKGSTNSTRPYQRKHTVDISLLRNVISVDTSSKTALVEPNVPMDRLVEATLKHGLVPPVVMEFPGITAGGGYAGTAGESSSFRHGFFNENINYVEIVLGNGDVVKASKSENADLFEGAAGAVGSLGITTMMELQLVDASKFVKATYKPVRSVAQAVEDVHAETKVAGNDYVDGILYSKEHGAIVTGELTNEEPSSLGLSKPQTFSHPWDPWFYLHVQDKTARTDTAVTELIPLAEYLFRYDRGGFWVGRSAFSYLNFPFNRFTRWLLNDFLTTRMLYRALHASGESSRYIVQDMALPYSTAEQSIDYTADKFGIWPLWLCPLKQTAQPTFHPYTGEKVSSSEQELNQMLNIGLWGFGPKDHETFVTANRNLEHRLREFGGMKWLYAHTYYPESEFWHMYDREWYDKLRKKYYAEALPSVYDKVRIDVEGDRKDRSENWSRRLRETWPLGGFYGIRKAIQSKDYLIARNSTWKWTDTSR